MTAGARVAILYEDARGPTRGFGLHALVERCVFDRVNEAEGAIKWGCTAPAALSVVLLERNLESVLRAAAECDPDLDHEEATRALDDKSRLARDAILMAAAREQQRQVRECMLAKMPSLLALVERVCQGLTR